MGKFFNVDVIPDCVNGDISVLTNDGVSAQDVGAGNILFDWTAVDVPSGSCLLRSVTAFINPEDGAVSGTDSDSNIELVFAKSVNGVVPPTMGSVNAAQTGCFSLRHRYIGGLVLDSAAGKGRIEKLAFGLAYITGYNGQKDRKTGLPLVVDLEPGSGTNVGYDKLYVMGFSLGARTYQTGVLADGAVTSDTVTSITTKGTQATKIFSPGDTVYIHDVNTALGTVKSVTATTITLNDVIAGGTNIADEDEIINANPVRLKLGFER